VTTEQPEDDSSKHAFLAPLIEFMKECRVVNRDSNASQSEHDDAYRRRAERLLKTAEVGTLSRAAMTAHELSHFCQARVPPVEVYEIGTTMIETFLWGHPSKTAQQQLSIGSPGTSA